MQIKNVHIVFSQATASNLKSAFRHTQYEKTESIIYLSDVRSVRLVESMYTLEGIEQRYRWLMENFKDDKIEVMKRMLI